MHSYTKTRIASINVKLRRALCLQFVLYFILSYVIGLQLIDSLLHYYVIVWKFLFM